MSIDMLTAQYPGSKGLPQSFTESYQPVSRAGELTANAFVDAFVYNKLESEPADGGNNKVPDDDASNGNYGREGDAVPRFEEWATVHPGEICVQAKYQETRYRLSMAAETASPVIACAQCMPEKANGEYFFAGIARSKSVRPYDDGRGPKVEEYLTLSIGGMVTILNNGKEAIRAGDVVEWTFDDDYYSPAALNGSGRKIAGPRRILVRAITSSTGTHTYSRAFGLAKSQANRGERFDVLLQQY